MVHLPSRWEAVGAREGGEERGTIASLRLAPSREMPGSPLQRGAPGASCLHSKLSLIFCPSPRAPHSCGREWGGPRGASARTERGGTGKVADSIVGNPPLRAGWGRRTGLGSVSGTGRKHGSSRQSPPNETDLAYVPGKR